MCQKDLLNFQVWDLQETVIQNKLTEIIKTKEAVDWEKRMRMEIRNFVLAMLNMNTC